MKTTTVLLAMLLLPLYVAADGLATSICVLDPAAYENLIKQYGEPAKIPTDALWKAAVHRGYLRDAYDATFKRDDASYRLLASRHGAKGQTIYSISREAEGKPAQLLCVGAIAPDEPKQNPSDDPFVVVLRQGNFLKQ